MCFSYILHFEPRYSADGTTAIWKEWEGSIHGKVVFINILTFYYILHFCYLYLGSRHKITCTMIRVTLKTQLLFYSNKKYLTVDINKKVWFRRSDDEWAHHGEQIVQKKLPDLISLIWGTLNCKQEKANFCCITTKYKRRCAPVRIPVQAFKHVLTSRWKDRWKWPTSSAWNKPVGKSTEKEGVHLPSGS